MDQEGGINFRIILCIDFTEMSWTIRRSKMGSSQQLKWVKIDRKMLVLDVVNMFVSLTISRLPSISAPDLFCCLLSLSLNIPICLNPIVRMCPIHHLVYNSLAVINRYLASYGSHPNCSFSWTPAYTLKDSKVRNIMETLREKMTELEIMPKAQRNKKS